MKKYIILFVFASIIFHYACITNGDEENPVPIISSLSPNTRASALPDFKLTVTGSGFIDTSRISIDGTPLDTDYISDRYLECRVKQSALETGEKKFSYDASSNTEYTVMVTNPTPGGGESNGMTFTITPDPEFSTAVNLSNSETNSSNPLIEINNDGKIFVCWLERENGFYDNPYGCYSSDGGQSWTSSERLFPNYESFYTSMDIASSRSGSIYLTIVSQDRNSSEYMIYLSVSSNFGKNWSPFSTILLKDSWLYQPKIKVDGDGNINLLYRDENGLMFIRSVDQGVNWSEPAIVAESIHYLNDVMQNDSGNFYFLWNTSYYDHIMYTDKTFLSYSENNFKNWETTQAISPIQRGDNAVAMHMDSKGKVYISYDQGENILMTVSSDMGKTWSNPLNLTQVNNPGVNNIFNAHSNMDSNGNINLIYGYQGIRFRRSIDGGVTMNPSIIVYDYGPNEVLIKSDEEGNIFILWANVLIDVQNVTFNGEIYFSRS